MSDAEKPTDAPPPYSAPYPTANPPYPTASNTAPYPTSNTPYPPTGGATYQTQAPPGQVYVAHPSSTTGTTVVTTAQPATAVVVRGGNCPNCRVCDAKVAYTGRR